MSSKQPRFCVRHNLYLPRDQFRPVRSLLCVDCEKVDTDNIAAGTHKRCSYGKHVVAIDQFNNLTETNCKPCISLSYERWKGLKAKKNEEINKENEETAGSNGEPKKQCNVCLVGKPSRDFEKKDADTGVISTFATCKDCCATMKKRRVGSRMKKVNKKLQKLSQAPALCTGPGIPWLDQCLFLPGLEEVHRLMNEDDLSEEERSRRIRAFSAIIDYEHNGTRHLKTLDKKGRTVTVSRIHDSEEEDRQLEITVCTCSNCHRSITSWFGEYTRVARADGSEEGSDDDNEEGSDDRPSPHSFEDSDDDDDDDYLAKNLGQKDNKENAGSNGELKTQCNRCFVGKPLGDFEKIDADTGVVSTVGQCERCRATEKKRRLGSRMKKVNKKLQKLSQAPALCTGPGLPWLNQCLFLDGLEEVHRLMNEDGLSEEERSRRIRAFSATIDNEHNDTRHLKTLDKKGRTMGVSRIQDSEEEDRQIEITVYTCSNCHRMTTSWFGENTRVARADGSKEGSNDGSEEHSDDNDALAENSGNKPQSPSAGQNAFGKVEDSNFADSEDEVAVVSKPKWKAPATKKMASFGRKMRASSSEDEDAVDDLLSSVDLGASDDEPVAPKPKWKAPATKKMAAFGRKKIASFSEDEDAVVELLSSDDEPVAPKLKRKAPATKKMAAFGRKKRESYSEDEDAIVDLLSLVNLGASDDEPVHSAAARPRSSRRAASAESTNYKFGGSDDDDESDIDEICGILQSPFHASAFFPSAFL